MLAETDEETDEAEVIDPPAAVVPATETTATPAAPQPGATEETPAQPATAPVQPQAPATEAPVAAQQPPAQKIAEELRAQAEAAVARETEQLEQWYQLPPEIASQIEADGVDAVLPKVLPQLAAKVHQAVTNAVLTRVNEVLPQAFSQFTQAREVETRAKGDFYSRWPGLKDYEQQVLQTGAWFRSQNPNATPQEALERVGAMVYTALGQPIPGAAQPAPSGSPTPSAPAPASRGTFRPATPGAGGQPAAPSQGGNEFEKLAEEFDLEDRG